MSSPSACLTRALLGGLLVLGLAGCTDDEPDSPGAPKATSTEPLSSTAPADADLLCDFLPRESIERAIGTTDYDVEGDLRVFEKPVVRQGVSGGCELLDDQGERIAGAEVRWPETWNKESVRRDLARADALDYVFPGRRGHASYYYDNGDEEDGPPDGAYAELIRDDYVVYVGVARGARGRDFLKDVVALTHQIVDALDLPAKSTLGERGKNG